MSWEQLPQAGGVRRRLLPAAVIVVLVIVAALLVMRSDRAATLAVEPVTPPVGSGAEAPSAVDPAAFRPVELDALQTVVDEAGNGPLLPDAADMTIVAADEVQLHVIDVATGAVRSVRLPEGLAPVPQPRTLFVVGDSLIISDTDDVVRVDGPDLRVTQLARDHRALRTFDRASIWLLDTESAGIGGTAVRVDLDGTVLDEVRLPAVARPFAGTSDGLVVWTPSGINLVSGTLASPLATSGDVAAVNGDRLARLLCAADLSCRIVIGTFQDPDQVRLPLPATDLPGGYFGLPAGEFSPDGLWLALPLYRIDSGRALDRTAISIINTATGVEVARARGISTRVFDNSPMAWSPDSRWLVVSSGDALRAWSVQQERFIALDVHVDAARDLVVR